MRILLGIVNFLGVYSAEFPTSGPSGDVVHAIKRNTNGLSTTTVDLEGTYRWELVLDIDNSQNEGHVERMVSMVTSIAASYNNMIKSIKENGLTTSGGFDIGGRFEVLSVGVKAGGDSRITNVLENMVQTHGETRTETVKTDVYKVGPRSKLTLYRLVFNGAGINYQTDTISSSPHPMGKVHIVAQLSQVFFLSGIDIVYTEDSVSRPENIIQEVDGWNPDINAGFGGKYVWLVPRWTSRPDEGVSLVQIVIQKEENKSYKDLAKGAGGDFRYIKLSKDPRSRKRIKEIALWRTDSHNSKPGLGGWEKWTIDINQGREKDYLYLCWKTTTV